MQKGHPLRYCSCLVGQLAEADTTPRLPEERVEPKQLSTHKIGLSSFVASRGDEVDGIRKEIGCAISGANLPQSASVTKHFLSNGKLR